MLGCQVGFPQLPFARDNVAHASRCAGVAVWRNSLGLAVEEFRIALSCAAAQAMITFTVQRLSAGPVEMPLYIFADVNIGVEDALTRL